jgi:HSP20 family protein
MSLIRWQPIQELDILRRQMDQLFEGLTEHDFPMLSINGGNKWIPAIEMQETDTEVILKAQVPGVEAKDLDVQVSPDAVMLQGEHQQETKTEEKEKGLYRSEFRYGKFARTVPLPKPVQHEEVKSSFKDGVLTLTMPKAVEVQQKIVKVDLTNQ